MGYDHLLIPKDWPTHAHFFLFWGNMNIQEEEDFANFLSEEFLFGVSEIENGVTKRAYLSSKLSCTKMRISKKFKGESF